MRIISSDQIKSIVRQNFNRSAELYQQFENRFGLFRFLTLELVEECGITDGMNVLDVGCGTGTSTFLIGKLVGRSGRVIGLDISEQMLGLARAELEKMRDLNQTQEYNIEFKNLDSDSLGRLSDVGINAVLYNACIFLIPEPENTLKAAYKLLKEYGVVGMNYIIGVYPKQIDQLKDEDKHSELFQSSKTAEKTFAPYGRRINDVTSLLDILSKIGFEKVRTGGISKKMSETELKKFYTIPAQSAALWPKTKYEDRLLLLEKCIDHFKECGFNNYFQHWGWILAEK